MPVFRPAGEERAELLHVAQLAVDIDRSQVALPARRHIEAARVRDSLVEDASERAQDVAGDLLFAADCQRRMKLAEEADDLAGFQVNALDIVFLLATLDRADRYDRVHPATWQTE